MHRKLMFLVFGVAVAVFGSLIGASPVSAHNTFDDSSPREGEVLAVSPPTWSITFQKSVPLESASGSIINGDGTRTTLPDPQHGASDNVIVFDLPGGLSGAISARWRLVSSDGHVISGRVAFLVQDPATTAVPSTPTTDNSAANDPTGTPDAIRAALRFLNFSAIVLVGGLFFVDFDVAVGALSLRRARRLIFWGTGALAVVPALQFFIFLDDIKGEDTGLTSAIGDALSLTPGAMLFVRFLAGVSLAWLVAATVRNGEKTRSMMASLVTTGVVYLVALGYVGHSRSQSAPWLGVPVDVVHTAAIAVWLGGLLALVVVVVPAVDATAGVAAFSRFSFVAERAVAAIAATGVIQTLRLHGNPINLASSTHGLLLVAKIAVVVIMIRLAARNRRTLGRYRTASVASADRSRDLLLRATTTEISFGVVVLALTAVLVAVTPG